MQCTEEGKQSGFRNGEKLSLPRERKEEGGIVGSEDEE